MKPKFTIKYRPFIQKWIIFNNTDCLLGFESQKSAIETIQFFYPYAIIEIYNERGIKQ